MERCPTCGRPGATVFDHLGDDCEGWPSDWTMADLKIPAPPSDQPATGEQTWTR